MTRLLRIREVLQLTGLSRSTAYSLMARGLCPRPVKISVRASAWREDEVQRWVDARTSSFPGIPVPAPVGGATRTPRPKVALTTTINR
jgi:prophage regulatory protein